MFPGAGSPADIKRPRTGVLGHSQPSLAGLFSVGMRTQD
jgi:hypothetical protein